MATAAGGLSLARMRDEFRDRVPDLLASDAFSDALVDEFLNGAHRFTVPTEVPGDIREGVWTFETTTGTSIYPFRPSDAASQHVMALNGPVFVDDFQIGSFRIPEWFWYYERPEDTRQSRPYSALIYGEQLELRPIPDAGYTIRAPGKLFPDALTDDGINERPRALATVCLAAFEAASRYNHHDLAREIEAEAGTHLDRTRTIALGTPRTRVPRRSF